MSTIHIEYDDSDGFYGSDVGPEDIPEAEAEAFRNFYEANVKRRMAILFPGNLIEVEQGTEGPDYGDIDDEVLRDMEPEITEALQRAHSDTIVDMQGWQSAQ